MNEAILVALISLVGTLGGTFGGIITAGKLTNYRLEQLEKRVNEHNNLVKRTYELEAKDKVFEERFSEFGKRIDSLQSSCIQ
ncbi:MAG: hypothetical protein IJ262_06945 [Clostridia bacterium]|nr:hypothetical protein [Clostridia bacterium]